MPSTAPIEPDGAAPKRRWPRGGVVAHSVLLSAALVLATSLAVGLAVVAVVNRQVERAADQRLQDGAALFEETLVDTREDLSAVGGWLSRDADLIAAVRDGRPDDIQARLALGLRLRAVDDVAAIAPDGLVLVRLQTDQPPSAGTFLGRAAGFQQALAGRTTEGIGRPPSGEPMRLETFVPLMDPGRGQVIGVLRLISRLDQADVDALKKVSGLDVSLFFGTERMATSLRGPTGNVLGVEADPAILDAITGTGQPQTAWRSLPIGQVRAYYAPLSDADGTRVGMYSVAIPTSAILGETRDALLPAVPVVLLISLLGTVLMYLVVGRVRRPVLALVAASARLEAGDLASPVEPVDDVDLAPLARALELARQSVGERLDRLAREEARLRLLVGSLHQPILTAGAEGRITSANEAALALFGSAGAVLGQPVERLLPGAELPAEAGEVTTWDGRVSDQTGKDVDAEVSITRLEGETGRRGSLLVALHDVSRHAELNRLREQLLYSVAHELRGPLSNLDNAITTLRTEYTELTTRELEQILDVASRTSGRLRTLMEGLLSAGSIQSGRFAVAPVEVPFAEILAEVIEMVEPLVTLRRQRVVVDPEAEQLVVMADARYLRQVMVNLLTNASNYSPEGEAIRVEGRQEPGASLARIAVRDEGRGIPADRQANLFERFYRVTPGSREPGVGLGLAIARGIIEAHGGAIGVESQSDRGTTVWFTLPVARPPEVRQRRRVAQPGRDGARARR